MILATALFFAALTVLNARPAHVKYDQRQEGQLNVRADLENFVVVVVPAPSSSGLGLLDLFRLAPRPNRRRHGDDHRPNEEEKQNFIESKTAPYHVDITKDDKGKIRPQGTETLLGKANEDGEGGKELKRFARAYLVAVPVEKDDGEKAKDDDGKRDHEKTAKKDKWKLVGAEYEQCGPDSRRDQNGICRLIKN